MRRLFIGTFSLSLFNFIRSEFSLHRFCLFAVAALSIVIVRAAASHGTQSVWYTFTYHLSVCHKRSLLGKHSDAQSAIERGRETVVVGCNCKQVSASQTTCSADAEALAGTEAAAIVIKAYRIAKT